VIEVRIMDFETVELLIAIREEFPLRFQNADAERMIDGGRMYKTTSGSTCPLLIRSDALTQAVFYKLA